jgi:hypothetical protein
VNVNASEQLVNKFLIEIPKVPKARILLLFESVEDGVFGHCPNILLTRFYGEFILARFDRVLYLGE